MTLKVQHRFLFLLLGIVLCTGLLLAGVHHHEGHESCWFCATAAAAILTFVALALAPPVSYIRLAQVSVSLPSWFLWVTRLHRGPPSTV